MEKKQKRKIVGLGIIVLVLFLCFVAVMVKMIIENGECVDDPFRYSAIRLEESGGNYYCKCQSLDPSLLDFSFSLEGIKIINPVDYDNLGIISLKGGLDE